ncbi:TPA: hypothetical protein ACJL7J_000415 [Neisseria meningitidis]|nr:MULTISPECIES: hypothetical protein [Neisseria]
MVAASRGGWAELANGLEKNRKGSAAVSVGLLQVQAYGFLCAALP